MPVIAWTEITAFNNIRKYSVSHPEILNDCCSVTYQKKIKLHGVNSGIQVYTDGRVIAQSRTLELINGNDNVGFAKWVESNKSKWASIADHTNENIIIFGEYVGKGVQSGVSVSDIPTKSFAVFAASIIDEEDSLIIEPYLLQELVNGIPDTYVLPWYGEPITIDWLEEDNVLVKQTEMINQWVAAVEANDPWVYNTFGIKGTGEGIVFYPTSKEHLGKVNYNNLCFKAKGNEHKVIKTALPAQINAEMAASIDQFVDMVLTTARLEQGAAGVYDIKLVGKFLQWVVADVQKECQDELDASNLTWAAINKQLSNKIRIWYIEKSKK